MCEAHPEHTEEKHDASEKIFCVRVLAFFLFFFFWLCEAQHICFVVSIFMAFVFLCVCVLLVCLLAEV